MSKLRQRVPSARPNTAEGGLRRRNAGDYVRLLFGCVVIAIVVALIGAILIPVEDTDGPHGQLESPSASMSREPTIDLPASPVAASAEEMRNELLALGRRLVDRFPNQPDALHVVALLHADLQKTTEAERLWRKCIELNPRLVGPHVGLASVLMEQGKDEAAANTLRQALATGCNTADVYDQLAAALMKLGELEEAAKVLTEGLTRYPQAARGWLQLGQVQIQLGRFDVAESSLQRALAEGESSDSVYFALATVCARLGKQDEAAKYRQQFTDRKKLQAAEADGAFQVRYDREMRRIAVATICQAGSIYDGQGQVHEAEALLLRAAQFDPRDRVVCGEMVRFYRQLGRIADARLAQLRLVEIDPANVPYQVSLASLSAQLGDHGQAEKVLQQVIATRPELSIGYASLAQLCLQTGRTAEARRLAEAALRRESTGPEETMGTCVVLAEACRLLGDQAAADAALVQSRQMARSATKADGGTP